MVSDDAKLSRRRIVRLYFRLLRRYPDYCAFWRFKPGSPRRFAAIRMWKRLDAAWDRCKREAIERAGGI
jgi:hypothetical protein